MARDYQIFYRIRLKEELCDLSKRINCKFGDDDELKLLSFPFCAENFVKFYFFRNFFNENTKNDKRLILIK